MGEFSDGAKPPLPAATSASGVARPSHDEVRR